MKVGPVPFLVRCEQQYAVHIETVQVDKLFKNPLHDVLEVVSAYI